MFQIRDVGEAATRPAAVVPVPASGTVSGVAPLLSVIDHEALRPPEAEGLKVMLAEQLVDAARVEPQVVDETVKSEALVPPTVAALSVTALDVVLETVMDCGVADEPTVTLPRLRDPGEATTEPEPVPDRETCWGLLLSVSVKLSVAVRVPVAVGLKRTVTVQLAADARAEPQVF